MDNKKLKQTICGEQPRHRNSFVSYLLRMFLLLAVMVCGAGNAWGGYTDGSINNGVDGTNGSNATWTQKTKTYAWTTNTSNAFTVNGLTNLSQGSHLILDIADLTGEYRVYITIGDKTYHRVLSATGQVVIDLKDNNWRTKVWDASTATKLPNDLSSVTVFFAGHSNSGSLKVNSFKLASLDAFEITEAPSSDPSWLRQSGSMKVAVKGFETSLSTTNGKKFLKLSKDTEDDSHIKLIFPKGMVKAGDILTVKMANYYNTASNVGFSVSGGGSANAYNAANGDIDVTYKIRSANVKSEDENQDCIILTRKDYGCAFNSFEISSPERYIVKWDNSKVEANCDAWYTIDDDPTEYRTTTCLAASNSSVTYHATSIGSTDFAENGWRLIKGETDKHLDDIEEYKSLAWNNPMTWTVTEDVNIYPEFTTVHYIKATTETIGGNVVGTAKAYTNTETKEDISTHKYKGWDTPIVYFEATPISGYQFDGWYRDGEKVSDNNPWNYGEYTSQGGTTDLNLTAKFTPKNTLSKPNCNHVTGSNGSNYFDITKLYTNLAITDFSSETGRTVTVPTTGGSMSYFFENEYDFGDLKSWTISDNKDLQNRISSIEYLDANGHQLAICYTNAGDRTLQDNVDDNNLRKKLDKVKEIRINFKSSTQENPITEAKNYQFKWICFTFEHADRVKPVLSEGTAKDMRVFTGENLILANNSGFWRQYTDNTYKTVESNGFILTNEWEKRYEIPANKLTKNADYYFRVVDEITCALGHTHSSEAVDVHVKVTDPINTVEVNGKTRQYDVYVPAGLTSSESSKVGVIFSLHGASNDYWNGRVDFNAIADQQKNVEKKKFIVVYPRGLMRQLRGQERGWETYTESNTEDVEFFKAIVGDIPTKYAGLTVDMSRIYLAGFSNGGMMAYKAAHQAGDFFAAFASVGGFPVNESHLFHAGSQPTPFIHIQGAADVEFSSTKYDLSTIAHNMTYRNGAHFNPYDTQHNSDGGVVACTDPKKVTREIHIADKGGAAYFLYKIAGMGHDWSYNWDGEAGDDVAQSIWNFFDYSGKVNNIDKTLKFRMDDPKELWSIATTGKSSQNAEVGYIGFDKVNQTVEEIHYVLSYGGRTKTDDGSTKFDKNTNNKNMWHSLQFNGGINGAAHFLKLNVETKDVGGAANENAADYFLVKLTKTGATTPVFSKRYQAGRGKKDLYINFVALPGFNEYKLEVTKSKKELVVKVHGMEFYSGRCEDKSTNDHTITENPVFFYNVEQVLTGMNPIYQPVYGKSYSGIAKEYLPIAEIPVGILPEGNEYRPSDIPVQTDYKVIENNLKISDAADATALTSLPSTVITDWRGATQQTISGTSHGSSGTPSYGKLFNIAKSGKTGEDQNIKYNNAFIFVPNGQTYTIDKVKGINISQLGRAKMPEYLNGTEGSFPTKGMIAIKLQGTLDFYLLAQNEVTYTGTDSNPARRTLKVYYTNDQLDGELKELKEWDFFGTRSENGYSDKNGQSLAPLAAGVRLPQLGKDGTCTVFITYEGKRENGGASFTHESTDEEKIWIKGFVIKRPDLKVTIGRTDSKYSSQEYNGETENTKCTRFGENKPYVWSFENVGFNNTRNKDGHSDINEKKINEKDDRTYVCGGSDDNFDHVLLYSDGESTNNDDKVQFDGRVLGKEHIEFLKASVYNIPTATDNRKIYDPIQSNGLKVNVTGSGWFKIMCSAPNGPVNMKVYTQPNYGNSYISLLREFRVEPVKDDDLKTGETKETAFREYTVYLKSRGIHNGNNGFWDGETADAGKEEIMRQSLFVVFDNIGEASSYAEGHPQLNIHQLSWLNEEPADYVFQREEDPKLLTTWQAIRRDGDGNKTLDDRTDDNVVLWWKTGNDDDTEYVKDGVSILKKNGQNTYNRLGQYTTNIADGKGVKSPGGYASASVPSDAGKYEAYWDIAAPASTNAHTEAAYANKGKVYTSETEYKYDSGNNTEFDMPISGSFIRICAMKNTYVVAHVLPKNGAATASVYVLDETGTPIPYKEKGTGLDDDAKIRGYVSSMENMGGLLNGGAAYNNGGTVRVDFTANAGKEYFICAKNASLSLARLEVHQWRNEIAKNEALVLEDNAANSVTIATEFDNARYYRDAKFKRNLTKDKWVSLVLPFSMNEKKFKEVFGDDAECIHFSGVDIPNKTVRLTHHYYNMVVAGRPVFVKPGKTISDGKTNGIDISDITLQTKTVRSTSTNDGQFKFVGSYDNTTMYRNDLFLNNNNAIKYLTTTSASYPGMRSFIRNGGDSDDTYDFYTHDNGFASQTKAMFLSFADLYDDIPTGLEEIITAEYGDKVIVLTKSTRIYDINGRMVSDNGDIKNLPAGVYIVNGNKYFVK